MEGGRPAAAPMNLSLLGEEGMLQLSLKLWRRVTNARKWANVTGDETTINVV